MRTCIHVIRPIGQAGRKAVFCGKPVVPGTYHCEDHQTMTVFERLVLRALMLLLVRASFGSSSGKLMDTEQQFIKDCQDAMK